jgi:hypothetical protein
MQTTGSSETGWTIYQNRCRDIPEGSNLQVQYYLSAGGMWQNSTGFDFLTKNRAPARSTSYNEFRTSITQVRIGCYRCHVSVPAIPVLIPMIVCRLVMCFEYRSSVYKMESLTLDCKMLQVEVAGRRHLYSFQCRCPSWLFLVLTTELSSARCVSTISDLEAPSPSLLPTVYGSQ